MSPRKIIFLVIIGILWLLIIYGIWNLSQSRKARKNIEVKSISVWVVWDTSEQYQNLFSEFSILNKTYKNTTIDIRVFPDYDKYQRSLLSTLSDGTGPDIFMVEWGGDAILESKVFPLPSSIVDLSNFDKKYEDIFLPLIRSEGTGKETTRSLVGVPLWYETLGLFYHKSLLRTVPKTWSEVETLAISSDKPSVLPTNLGFNPLYTPYATDIIAYFMWKGGIVRSTKDIGGGDAGIGEYLAYALRPPEITPTSNDLQWETNISPRENAPSDIRKEMNDGSLTTIDLFIRGKIAMIVWFPSLIREIEKSEKRGWKEVLSDIILTEKLPQDSLWKKRVNIARYRYLALSKKSENLDAAADLLAYLMSETGWAKAQEAFPLMISPLRSWSEWQKETRLSEVFARTRLDAFIPDLQEDIFVFQYGIKWEYEKIFRELIDRNEKIDINNLSKTIGKNVECELEGTLSWVLSEACLNPDN